MSAIISDSPRSPRGAGKRREAESREREGGANSSTCITDMVDYGRVAREVAEPAAFNSLWEAFDAGRMVAANTATKRGV